MLDIPNRLVPLATVLVGALTLLSGFGRSDSRSRSSAAGRVEHVGITRAGRTANFGSARPGRIAHVLVQPGDLVHQDQLLFELESRVEQLEVERLKAEADGDAEVNLALAREAKAKAQADRAAELAEQSIESEASASDAMADYKIAQAEVARAKSRQEIAKFRRDEAQSRLERLRGRSPFAGRIESVEHEAGECIDALEKIVTIINLDRIDVDFQCPVAELADWKPGSLAVVRTVSNDQFGIATVRFVSRSVDIASQTVLVRLELRIDDTEWLIGQKVMVRHTDNPSTPAPPTGQGK